MCLHPKLGEVENLIADKLLKVEIQPQTRYTNIHIPFQSLGSQNNG